jgi:hypothetical protein
MAGLWPEIALEGKPVNLHALILLSKKQKISCVCTNTHATCTYRHTHTSGSQDAKPWSHRASPGWGAAMAGPEQALPFGSLCRTPTSCPGSPAPPHKAGTARGRSPARSASWSPVAPPASCSTGHRIKRKRTSCPQSNNCWGTAAMCRPQITRAWRSPVKRIESVGSPHLPTAAANSGSQVEAEPQISLLGPSRTHSPPLPLANS